ncbi:unnamed protein product [Allacma fusca]|uniref:Uncharacterized protein n=1 Tax=Allacma fusca TaxID=39272 RepID=A0A8J2Q553_9HEXA|nr:unnamed protein product [Allacma fusca]
MACHSPTQGHVMEFSGNGSVRVRRGSSDGKKRKAIASGVAWALCDQWEVHLEENCITAPIKKDTPGNDVKCGWYDWTRCTASSCKPFKLDKC